MAAKKKAKKAAPGGANGRFKGAMYGSTLKPKNRQGAERADAIERRRSKERCPVKIAAEDVEKKADALAKVIQDRGIVLAERSEALGDYRKKLSFFDERLEELAESVRSHSELRDVECVEFLLERTGEVVIIRQDTGEQVGEARAATAEDRQDELALDQNEANNSEADGEEEEDDDTVTRDELANADRNAP